MLTTSNKQQGSTLIEVLVAIIVLSVGILGMTALQARSLQSNYSAYYRSQATILATDISDRMRANRAASINGAYNFALKSNHNAGASLADRDLNQWFTELQELPGAQASIARAASGIVTITLRWNDSRGAIADAAGNISVADSQATFIYQTEI